MNKRKHSFVWERENIDWVQVWEPRSDADRQRWLVSSQTMSQSISCVPTKCKEFNAFCVGTRVRAKRLIFLCPDSACRCHRVVTKWNPGIKRKMNPLREGTYISFYLVRPHRNQMNFVKRNCAGVGQDIKRNTFLHFFFVSPELMAGSPIKSLSLPAILDSKKKEGRERKPTFFYILIHSWLKSLFPLSLFPLGAKNDKNNKRKVG